MGWNAYFSASLQLPHRTAAAGLPSAVGPAASDAI